MAKLLLLAALYSVTESLQVDFARQRAVQRSVSYGVQHITCLQGTSRRDDDDDAISDEDVEDLFFMFDSKGSPKAWAVKPHLQTMVDEIKSGDAMLLDIRSAAAWKAGHLNIATSCPLAGLALELEAAPWDKALIVYTHSGFGDEEAAYTAAEALTASGYDARPLAEPFEALKVQLPQ